LSSIIVAANVVVVVSQKERENKCERRSKRAEKEEKQTHLRVKE